MIGNSSPSGSSSDGNLTLNNGVSSATVSGGTSSGGIAGNLSGGNSLANVYYDSDKHPGDAVGSDPTANSGSGLPGSDISHWESGGGWNNSGGKAPELGEGDIVAGPGGGNGNDNGDGNTDDALTPNLPDIKPPAPELGDLGGGMGGSAGVVETSGGGDAAAGGDSRGEAAEAGGNGGEAGEAGNGNGGEAGGSDSGEAGGGEANNDNGGDADSGESADHGEAVGGAEEADSNAGVAGAGESGESAQAGGESGEGDGKGAGGDQAGGGNAEEDDAESGDGRLAASGADFAAFLDEIISGDVSAEVFWNEVFSALDHEEAPEFQEISSIAHNTRDLVGSLSGMFQTLDGILRQLGLPARHPLRGLRQDLVADYRAQVGRMAKTLRSLSSLLAARRESPDYDSILVEQMTESLIQSVHGTVEALWQNAARTAALTAMADANLKSGDGPAYGLDEVKEFMRRSSESMSGYLAEYRTRLDTFTNLAIRRGQTRDLMNAEAAPRRE